jgi:hypothetical protein
MLDFQPLPEHSCFPGTVEMLHACRLIGFVHSAP